MTTAISPARLSWALMAAAAMVGCAKHQAVEPYIAKEYQAPPSEVIDQEPPGDEPNESGTAQDAKPRFVKSASNQSTGNAAEKPIPQPPKPEQEQAQPPEPEPEQAQPPEPEQAQPPEPEQAQPPEPDQAQPPEPR